MHSTMHRDSAFSAGQWAEPQYVKSSLFPDLATPGLGGLHIAALGGDDGNHSSHCSKGQGKGQGQVSERRSRADSSNNNSNNNNSMNFSFGGNAGIMGFAFGGAAVVGGSSESGESTDAPLTPRSEGSSCSALENIPKLRCKAIVDSRTPPHLPAVAVPPPPGLGFEVPRSFNGLAMQMATSDARPKFPPGTFAPTVAAGPATQQETTNINNNTTNNKEGIEVREHESGDGYWLDWTVRVAKLRSKDKQIMSPEVQLPNGGSDQGSKSFKLFLVPLAKGDKKGQGSFLQAKSRGKVAIKCLDSANPGEKVAREVSVSVGTSPLTAPLSHDFAEQSHCEPTQLRAWDFMRAAKGQDMFVVHVLVQEGVGVAA
mmetsp:Transcript_45276/g.97084  ORF Transcript_45276/g.97084 Transcript_45276/m.97084 type:complete len:371 (+) Transcript_45276:271-1383(+)